MTVKDDGKHDCPAPGCKARVMPAMLGCRTHWFQLPQDLRNAINRTYRRGQERNPSMVTDEYRAALRACIEFWLKKAEENASKK